MPNNIQPSVPSFPFLSSLSVRVQFYNKLLMYYGCQLHIAMSRDERTTTAITNKTKPAIFLAFRCVCVFSSRAFEFGKYFYARNWFSAYPPTPDPPICVLCVHVYLFIRGLFVPSWNAFYLNFPSFYIHLIIHSGELWLENG